MFCDSVRRDFEGAYCIVLEGFDGKLTLFTGALQYHVLVGGGMIAAVETGFTRC